MKIRGGRERAGAVFGKGSVFSRTYGNFRARGGGTMGCEKIRCGGKALARRIVLTSGKGGVGKTTVAVRLGMRLAAAGARVVLADADFGLNNIDVVCGLENAGPFDVADVVLGRCRPRQALVPFPGRANLFVLPSGRAAAEHPVSPQALRLVFEQLSPRFDYILIDSPAGIGSGFHRAAAAAGEALVVTTPHVSALRDAARVLAVLQSYRLQRVDLVVNMVRADMVAGGEVLSPHEIAAALRVPLIGVIPQEDGVFLGEEGGAARKAFRLLASAVAGGPCKVYEPAARGLFGGLRRAFGRRP